ncbi:MAG TPA: ABC transporter permease, partial [Humisphaera sp.]
SGLVPEYILPRPHNVLRSLWDNRAEFLKHAAYTGTAAVVGFTASAVLGVAGAVALSSSRWVRRAFYPYAVFFQTVPLVAVAPLLVIVLGTGSLPVVVSAFIVSVFPVLANALAGLLATDPALLDLFKLYGAGPVATLWKLRLPAALPQVLTGLRVAAGLAVIGAIVGEFFAGAGGLGYAIDGRKTAQRPQDVFALLLLAAALGIAMFVAINAVSSAALKNWHPSERE